MAGSTSARRKLAARIAGIQQKCGPEDPRLPGLRRQLDAIAVEEIRVQAEDILVWAHRARAALPSLDPGEIDAVGLFANRLDRRARAAAAAATGTSLPPARGKGRPYQERDNVTAEDGAA
jgi:hypothetical protein